VRVASELRGELVIVEQVQHIRGNRLVVVEGG
jgi:hypothetical protein